MNTRPDIASYDDFLEQLMRIRAAASGQQESALLHVSIDHFRATLRTYPGRTDAVACAPTLVRCRSCPRRRER